MVFYNDRTGVLFVRASIEELGIVQAAIETINPELPEQGMIPGGPGAGILPQGGGAAGAGFGGSGLGGGFGGRFGGRFGGVSLSPDAGQKNQYGFGPKPEISSDGFSLAPGIGPPKRTVTVLGQVNKPGVHEIPYLQEWRVIDAIATAGGLSNQANKNHIEVTRAGKTHQVKFDDLRKSENLPEEISRLESGDIIYVPEAKF